MLKIFLSTILVLLVAFAVMGGSSATTNQKSIKEIDVINEWTNYKNPAIGKLVSQDTVTCTYYDKKGKSIDKTVNSGRVYKLSKTNIYIKHKVTISWTVIPKQGHSTLSTHIYYYNEIVNRNTKSTKNYSRVVYR